MNDLKPCPFCGGSDIHVITNEYSRDVYIICQKCSAQFAVPYWKPIEKNKTITRAVNLWNSRYQLNEDGDA